MTAPRYECDCGWIGTEDEMEADSVAGCDDADEIWSKCIGPECNYWAECLTDFKEVPDDVG